MAEYSTSNFSLLHCRSPVQNKVSQLSNSCIRNCCRFGQKNMWIGSARASYHVEKYDGSDEAGFEEQEGGETEA
jgi:hypothetical protein